jgi:hypothetical protein
MRNKKKMRMNIGVLDELNIHSHSPTHSNAAMVGLKRLILQILNHSIKQPRNFIS